MTRRRTEIATALLVGVGITMLGWKALQLNPRPGIDPSWAAALHMAAGSGLDWGRELAFTYGPLGHIKVPTYWSDATGILAVLYAFLTRVAVAATMWAVGRRTFGSVGAALLALAILPFVENPLPVLMLAWALWLLSGDRTDRQRLTFAIGAGALGGLELLGKINTGVLVVALGAIAVTFAPRDRLRSMAVFGASVAGGLVLGWLVSGQRLLDLNDYLVNAAEVASGYSQAMVFTVEGVAWQYTVALVLGAGALYAAYAAAPWSIPRARTGMVLAVLVYAWMGFKSGFVRHDPQHAIEFFGLLLPAFLVIPYRRGQRGFALGAVAAAFVALVAVSGARIDELVDPLDRVDHAWSDVTTVVRPGERERIQSEWRNGLKASYGIDPALLELLQGQTVDVQPYEAALAWVYEVDWKPLPVFQSYQAYTRHLDELNADALLASDAPGRVIVGAQTPIDNRQRGWESPAAIRALLCRYRPIGASGGWMVLGRGENRCGPERPIATVTAKLEDQVDVPPPSPEGMVIVRIHGLEPGLAERVRAMLYKGYERNAYLDNGGPNRLLPGTAEDGLVLHIPPQAEWPPGFERAPHPKTMAVARQGGGDDTLRYEFSLVPVAP